MVDRYGGIRLRALWHWDRTCQACRFRQDRADRSTCSIARSVLLLFPAHACALARARPTSYRQSLVCARGAATKAAVGSACPGVAELRAVFDVELFAQARETQPKNMNKTYDPKQKVWQQFCAEKGFEDGELVCENKLIRVLNERVLDRELRTLRYTKENRTTTGGESVRQTLGPSAVKSYVAAIVDLWSF